MGEMIGRWRISVKYFAQQSHSPDDEAGPHAESSAAVSPPSLLHHRPGPAAGSGLGVAAALHTPRMRMMIPKITLFHIRAAFVLA